MRLKHLGVRIITCGLMEGRLNLPYNNSANMPASIVSYFLLERDFRSGLCTHAVGLNALKIFALIISRRLYNAEDINKKKR